MELNESDTPEASSENQTTHSDDDTTIAPVAHEDLSQWRGRDLLDRDGERIGRLEDVYFDIETDQPQFGTVKEGFIDRHLTFVPLVPITIGPDSLQVAVTKKQVKDAPNMEHEGEALTQADESLLYHYYQMNYIPTDNPSGRRLGRR